MLIALALVPAAAAAAPPVAILLVAAPRLVIVTAAFEAVAHSVTAQGEPKVVCLLRINSGGVAEQQPGPTRGLTWQDICVFKQQTTFCGLPKLFKAVSGSVSWSCVAGKSFVWMMPVHANSAVMAC
jgi:hypothetical protein